MEQIKPILWRNNKLYVLDQRLLPHQEVVLECTSVEGVHMAIKDMAVRGAPVIGFTALYGMMLWLLQKKDFSRNDLENVCSYIVSARPTAVNLMFEIEEFKKFFLHSFAQDNKIHVFQTTQIFEKSLSYAHKRYDEINHLNLKMAKFGYEELHRQFASKNKWNLMTHCNTGSLACGELGTALGVIDYTSKRQSDLHVWVDETRPYLQGSRLTAYELGKNSIPHSIVVEGAASYLMSHNMVDAIFVGADRIVLNGDTANKVGTSNLAIVAHYYDIPFYVVAPKSSFDLSLESGKQIDIELRDPSEILGFKDQRIAPYFSSAFNPSFDVTPHELITGIICEDGVIHRPTLETMKSFFQRS